MAFIPASSIVQFYQHLYNKNYNIDKVYVFSPYEDYVKFYRKVDIQYPQIKLNEAKDIIKKNASSYFITTNSDEKNELLTNTKCKIDFALAPLWLYELPI